MDSQNKKSIGAELDPVSAERMEKMNINAGDATHEEIMRFSAIASTYYLSKIRFWVTFWSVLILIAGAVWVLAALL